MSRERVAEQRAFKVHLQAKSTEKWRLKRCTDRQQHRSHTYRSVQLLCPIQQLLLGELIINTEFKAWATSMVRR